MKVLKGDMWSPEFSDYIKCITTNGSVKNDGTAVMGRGVALQAKNKFLRIEEVLGKLITKNGNRVYWLNNTLLSFPVKHHWKEKADLFLIANSCVQLLHIMDWFTLKKVLLPKPGCGNGQLSWENEVEPVCRKYFDKDARISIIDKN